VSRLAKFQAPEFQSHGIIAQQRRPDLSKFTIYWIHVVTLTMPRFVLEERQAAEGSLPRVDSYRRRHGESRIGESPRSRTQ
jgi:hypothetical protein